MLFERAPIPWQAAEKPLPLSFRAERGISPWFVFKALRDSSSPAAPRNDSRRGFFRTLLKNRSALPPEGRRLCILTGREPALGVGKALQFLGRWGGEKQAGEVACGKSGEGAEGGIIEVGDAAQGVDLGLQKRGDEPRCGGPGLKKFL